METARPKDRKTLEIAADCALGDIQRKKVKAMKHPLLSSAIRILALLLLAGLAASPALFAQYGGGGSQQQQQQQPPPATGAQQGQPAQQGAAPAQAEAPKLDPEEEAAYKKFYDLKATDPDAVIKQGEAFVQKYPTSKYGDAVYSALANAYSNKEQFDKMYAAGDKALALNPNNVDVLVLVGWVIPHRYDPNDMDSNRLLDKAEDYEKRALVLLATLTKPEAMTQADFDKTRAEKTAQAHSGLGLVYFRKQEFDSSAKELDQAVKLSTTPDSVDILILGRDYQMLKRYSDAQDAYHKCAQMQGPVQDRCKQAEGDMKKLAASQPAAKP